MYVGYVKGTSAHSQNSRRSNHSHTKSDWVVIDSLNISRMGEGHKRLKERLLLAEYRYVHTCTYIRTYVHMYSVVIVALDRNYSVAS